MFSESQYAAFDEAGTGNGPTWHRVSSRLYLREPGDGNSPRLPGLGNIKGMEVMSQKTVQISKIVVEKK